MKILAIYYGCFPEIEKLHTRFVRGQRKIKVVVDVDEDIDDSRENFLGLYRHTAQFLPTLRHHSCCEQWEAAPLYLTEEEGVSIKRIGEIADFPHLLEHLIVDLQCTLGEMTVCSGVTCGWKKPENRFDLFVECDDPRIGIFAACFSAHLINNYLSGCPGEDDFNLVLKLAAMVESYPETKAQIARLATCLNESIENIIGALQQLADLNYFLERKELEDENQA